jgi:hypothetical protein
VSTLQIAFTALATVIGGALTLVVGQIIVRGALEPALELKGLIGTIASDMDFYANKFEAQEEEWRDLFRKHSCSLREKLNVMIGYSIFERLFQLPSEQDVEAAAAHLIGYSNRPTRPYPGYEGLPDTEIKRLLRIKPKQVRESPPPQAQ